MGCIQSNSSNISAPVQNKQKNDPINSPKKYIQNPEETTITQNKKTTKPTVSSGTSEKISLPKNLQNQLPSIIKPQIQNQHIIIQFNQIRRIFLKHSMNKIHLNAMCTKCKLINLPYIRYKCLICPGFSLCSNCHYDQPQFQNHKKSHPMLVCQKPLSKDQENLVNLMAMGSNRGIQADLQNKKLIQNNLKCSGCQQKPFYGIKLKCDTCAKMYLCWNCYINKKYGVFLQKHNQNHSILAFLFYDNIDIDKDIQIIQDIGQGAFGKVTKVKRKSTNQIFALKTTILEFENEKQIQNRLLCFSNQLEAYENLIDANIITYKGVHLGKQFKQEKFRLKLQILLEFMPKGSLSDIIGKQKISNIQKLFIVIDILSGLKKIHKKGYVHRDLKPQNIFIDIDYMAKLGDLGLTGQQMMQGVAGTPLWLPSQAFQLIQLKIDVLITALSPLINTQGADIFAIGLIINFIFTETMHKRSIDGFVHFQKNSPYFQHIILSCLALDPAKRPNAEILHRGFYALKTILDQAFKQTKSSLSQISIEQQNQLFDNLYSTLMIKK